MDVFLGPPNILRMVLEKKSEMYLIRQQVVSVSHSQLGHCSADMTRLHHSTLSYIPLGRDYISK